MTEVAPAGIVKSPEVDGVLDKVEEALDGADFYNEFIEGSVIDSGEIRARTASLKEIALACNTRLAPIGVKLIGAYPELAGFGGRFVGVDGQNNSYQVDLHRDDEARMANARFDHIEDGRDSVNMICDAIYLKYHEYQAKAG